MQLRQLLLVVLCSSFCATSYGDQKVRRQIALSAPYLVMPIQDKAEACPVTISLGDEQLACVTVELARDKVDFWTFLDLTGHRGKTVTLSAENPPSGFDEIRSSDSIPGADNLYHEKYRPRFHFSSKRGRMNDANGLVYYKGQPSLSVLLLRGAASGNASLVGMCNELYDHRDWLWTFVRCEGTATDGLHGPVDGLLSPEQAANGQNTFGSRFLPSMFVMIGLFSYLVQVRPASVL